MEKEIQKINNKMHIYSKKLDDMLYKLADVIL